MGSEEPGTTKGRPGQRPAVTPIKATNIRFAARFAGWAWEGVTGQTPTKRGGSDHHVDGVVELLEGVGIHSKPKRERAIRFLRLACGDANAINDDDASMLDMLPRKPRH